MAGDVTKSVGGSGGGATRRLVGGWVWGCVRKSARALPDAADDWRRVRLRLGFVLFVCLFVCFSRRRRFFSPHTDTDTDETGGFFFLTISPLVHHVHCTR